MDCPTQFVCVTGHCGGATGDQITSKRNRFAQLDGENATVSAVLNEIQNHNWGRFACHGKQNPANPIFSAHYLHDGALDLAAITHKSDKRGEFAFLLVCQTATDDDR